MHTFFHLQKADLHVCQKIVKFRVGRHDRIHLQNNRFVFPLHDFQFTELYRNDAIGPMTESIPQHALCIKKVDEKEKIKIEITGEPYRIGATLNLLFGKSKAALPQCLLFPTYRSKSKDLNMKPRHEDNL